MFRTATFLALALATVALTASCGQNVDATLGFPTDKITAVCGTKDSKAENKQT